MSEEGAVIQGKWEPAPRRWFVFGDNGVTCDIDDGEQNVMLGIRNEMVWEILEARDCSVDAWLAWAETVRDPR